MITTATADTLAGLFAGTAAPAGDAAAVSGPAFGQVLSANVASPTVSAMASPPAMPGINMLPIGTLVGTGSLPVTASSMPAVLAWSASALPVNTASATAPDVPLSPPSTTATKTEPSMPSALAVADARPKPIAADAQPAKPSADEIAPDPSAPVDTGSAPTKQVAKAVDTPLPPTPSPTEKTDTSPSVVGRPIGTQVAPLADDPTASSPIEPETVGPDVKTPSTKPVSVKRAEAKIAPPIKPDVAIGDPSAMSIALSLLPVAPSDDPVAPPNGDDPGMTDDDTPDDGERKPAQTGELLAGAIRLPAELVAAQPKTMTVAAERPMTASPTPPHPATIAPVQADDTGIETGDMASSRPMGITPLSGTGTREEVRVNEARPATTQPASFATLVTHAERAAAPVAATPTPSAPVEPRVTAEPGRMGQEMGVAIARHAAAGGGEAMTVRLDPVEFGRIEVTLSFDDSGTIRAVVAADSPAALDVLRRDSADLGRSLADAGIRSDAQSFRFDTRQGSADGSGQGGQRWQQQSANTGSRTATPTADDAVEPQYRPLRTSGRVDLMA